MSKKIIWKLPKVSELKEKFPLSEKASENILQNIEELKNIFSWKDSRKILIIGPCSADFEESLYEYWEFLSELQEKVKDKIKIVFRFYTGKPRTVWGWKWLSYSVPWENPDLLKWMENTRRIAINLIEKFWLALAEEMLHPEMSDYFDDIFSYEVVWARSVENQYHREVMSWVSCPVWMKNHTLWDLQFMVNAIAAASNSSSYVSALWEIYETTWNPFAHWVHRWAERWWTNYDLGSIKLSYELMEKRNILNKGIIIDCNHDNSKKDPFKQIAIMSEVLENISKDSESEKLKTFVKGFMVESYLYDWRQEFESIETVKKGLSLTDPCIWKEGTREFVEKMYKYL